MRGLATGEADWNERTSRIDESLVQALRELLSGPDQVALIACCRAFAASLASAFASMAR